MSIRRRNLTLSSLTQRANKVVMFNIFKRKNTTVREDSFEKHMWYNHRKALKRIKHLEHSVNELLLCFEDGKPRGRSQDKSSITPNIGGKQDG